MRKVPDLNGYEPPRVLDDIIIRWAWTKGYISRYEVLGWLAAEYHRGLDEGNRRNDEDTQQIARS